MLSEGWEIEMSDRTQEITEGQSESRQERKVK